MSSGILTSTAEIERQVLLFQSVSGVCLALGGVSLLLTVFLFWRFRIANVIAFKLGITARQSIREIEETNAAAASRQEENATALLEKTFVPPVETTTRLDTVIPATTVKLETETAFPQMGYCGNAETKGDAQPEKPPLKLEILCDIMMLHTEERIG